MDAGRAVQVKKFVLLIFSNNRDLVIHRQVKTSDIISRRFRDFMTPLSRVQMRVKLTNASSRGYLNFEPGSELGFEPGFQLR